jgi:hypothetical protein
MIAIKEMAEVYRLGLLTGLFSKEDVIAWADSIVRSESKPDYAFIEVSMSKNMIADDVANHLGSIKGTFDSKLPSKVLLGLLSKLFESDSIKAYNIPRIIYTLANIAEVPDDDKTWMMCFDDDYELAKSGKFGDVEVLRKELKIFLSKYNEFANLFPAAA